jgi:hypothetical protein
MRTVIIGFGILAVFALLLVWLVSSDEVVTSLAYWEFYLCVLLAPLAWIWLAGGVGEAGTLTVALCLVTFLGVGASAFLQGRSKVIGAIIGFSLWAYFEFCMATVRT